MLRKHSAPLFSLGFLVLLQDVCYALDRWGRGWLGEAGLLKTPGPYSGLVFWYVMLPEQALD